MTATGDQRPTVTVVVVAHNSAPSLTRMLPVLQGELDSGDEVIVVDNASVDGSADVAAGVGRVIRSLANDGFPRACNLGAAAAKGELLVFLNPDAVPQSGWGAAIREPWNGRWVAWQALITTDGGRRVNSAGSVVHFTGVTWAGGAGDAVDQSVASHDVPALSGACLAIPASRFRDVGGFEERFFLYQEDTDLSLRLRLAGGHLGLHPAARVDHDYAFEKGTYKWRLLERNRWAVLVRCWPGPLLLASAPALVAAELAIWVVAGANGWPLEKARATAETVAALPRLLAERQRIQRERRLTIGEFADQLTWEPSSAFLGWIGRSRLVARGLRAYWTLVRRLVAP